jgi:flagellin
MSAIINTNLSAIEAQNSLRTSGLAQQQAMERLSSGLRINNAKDDAAGLAISSRMTSNINGIAAAIRNANDGISLTQTAEGSLAAIQDNLQRIRELAVQSANSSNTASDRNAMNAESTQLISEIDRVASNTTFNGINLLDGSYSNQSFQVGSGNSSNDRLTISIASAKSSALGGGSGSLYTTSIGGSAINAGTALTAGGININGVQIGASGSDGVSTVNSSGSALAKANAINAVSASTGVTATVGAAVSAAYTAGTTGGAFDFNLNGVSVSGTTNTAAAGATAATNANIIVAAINAVSSQTGVIATADGTGKYSLSAADGRNINIDTSTGITGVAVGDTGLTANTSATTYGKISLSSASSSGITIGGTQATTAILGIGPQAVAATTTAAGGVASVDLSTITNAQSALTTLDNAIISVTNSRASMGAYQNRFNAAITNLSTTTMNLQASRSRILDTDYASETTNLAKSQIIQQAATAMLAQANQSSQSVLALLK